MHIWAYCKCEKVYFASYFLNKHIFFDNPYKLLKFETKIHEGHLEGSVSQNSYLGPSFYCMQSRKKGLRKLPKVTRFFT